ncbi:MAG: aconitate hydratase AcnA [Acidobacteria bacterium]|nr:MAG: aconitate hydratase AcnA [Acidobacteriota bacterium]
MPPPHNSFNTRTDIRAGGQTVQIYSLPALERAGFSGVSRLPYSMKILLENLLRREDDAFVKADDIRALAEWKADANVEKEISFMPARVLLQDFTGVPCVVDLAAMRDAMVDLGGNPDRINPLQPVELVIDHSVQVDYFGRADAFSLNAELEFSRNRERYAFLRWGQRAFRNFDVVPPDTGIVHQVNIEHLARVIVSEKADGATVAYPDTVFGTDSHTTMVNGLGVVGWGVGGIEAEAAMLGQPSSMLIPQVLGVRLTGALPRGATATDLVLTITELLRKQGVVGKFVEFFGEGLKHLTIADRATLGNMCPEYGATVAIFPIDEMTLDYLRLTGRDESHVQLVEAYARAQGLFRVEGAPDAMYSGTVELVLDTVEPSLAGPRRPQDRVSLMNAKAAFQVALPTMLVAPKTAKVADAGGARQGVATATGAVAQSGVAVADPALEELRHGAVVIAAITSCTNTSNPSVMIGAGLVAKKAVERGLTRKPWVKTSLAPGSKVVTEYLQSAGLTQYLDQLGFDLVGYGCTTCIGNSGPLPDEVASVVREKSLVVCSVLSGNRNFEGRIQQDVRANYLASPPLVVAYAIAGWITKDLTCEPLGEDKFGKPVYLKDIWPTEEEIQETMQRAVNAEMFKRSYSDVFKGDERWQQLPVPEGNRYAWDGASTYIRKPSITTDHISPAGSIKADSPAGKYLIEHGVKPSDFNSYGARRGNHEVMMRGTFANTRLRNQLAPGTEGGWTTYRPGDEVMTIYEASVKYRVQGVPLMVIAGKEYGSGSSRDWAAKGTYLLGVKVVIAESFERIHRSNLVNMGVLPLQFGSGETAASLKLTGTEEFSLAGAGATLRPRGEVRVQAKCADGTVREFTVMARVDTPEELIAFRHGGILPYVVRQLVSRT